MTRRLSGYGAWPRSGPAWRRPPRTGAGRRGPPRTDPIKPGFGADRRGLGAESPRPQPSVAIETGPARPGAFRTAPVPPARGATRGRVPRRARNPRHSGRRGMVAGAGSIGGPALLLAGWARPHRWPSDAVPVTSPGHRCCCRGGAGSIGGYLMLLGGLRGPPEVRGGCPARTWMGGLPGSGGAVVPRTRGRQAGRLASGSGPDRA